MKTTIDSPNLNYLEGWAIPKTKHMACRLAPDLSILSSLDVVSLAVDLFGDFKS